MKSSSVTLRAKPLSFLECVGEKKDLPELQLNFCSSGLANLVLSRQTGFRPSASIRLLINRLSYLSPMYQERRY